MDSAGRFLPDTGVTIEGRPLARRPAAASPLVVVPNSSSLQTYAPVRLEEYGGKKTSAGTAAKH